MDVSLHAQRPILLCRRQSLNQNENTHFHHHYHCRPPVVFTGFFSQRPFTRFSKSNSWHVEYPANWILRPPCATGAGDFSKKKPKKWSRPRTKGPAPKAPAGSSSTKRDQKNLEDSKTSVTTAQELDSRVPNVGSVSADDEDFWEASQVNELQEKREGTTNGKVGDSSLPNKVAVATGKNLLKEIEAVKGFIGDEKASIGTVGDETRVEAESTVEGDQGYATVKSYQTIAVDNNIAEKEVLGSETSNLDTGISDEKEAEDLAMESNPNISAGPNKTEAVVLAAETQGSDIVTYEKQVKDLIKVQEDVALTTYPSSKSHENVTETELLATDMRTSDITSSNEMEDNTSVIIQENFDLEQSQFKESGEVVSETDIWDSETRDTVTSDEEEVETTVTSNEKEQETLINLELEKKARELEEALRRLELEREALARKKVLEELAEENLLKNNKMFIYPGTAKPDQDIEVFLNRSISTLKNEPDVVIMGAFNDWRWKSFTLNLEKSHLRGDWWSCQIHVPKEAYSIDFVFFNGKDVYDNNSKKDFHIDVEGGMDVLAFEDFLLEEKRRELEELAKQQAEKERQAEEQRCIEEEKAARETDRAQAKVEVERKKKNLRERIKNAVTSLENVWFFRPAEFKGGDVVRLYYNRSSGPLAQANDIWIHGGHDGWEYGLTIVARFVKSEEEGADWWYAEVTVPDQAVVLDWVFADGPPQKASVYDNNKRQDFHAIVPKAVPNELYWVEEEQRLYWRLQEERRSREEAIRAKAEKTARKKAEMKAKTLKTFLLSQRHIVFTDPVDIQAGDDVTVYYNPSNTVLNGKPEVWFRCSFNSWTHRRGPLAPQKMLPAENGSHVKATVKVPLDAYVMDFVFSDKEDGGIFDNKNGMDYHIPVFGGIAKEPPMHIVHIAVEMAPIAKVGGLGDIVTSLSRAVQDLNHHVDIVLPKYDCLNLNHVKDLEYQKSYPWGGIEIKVFFGKVEGLPVYFLEPQNGMFSTGCVYAGKNDGERFGFFCHAALEFLLQSGFHPDIIHCHDWSSAPVAWLYKEHYRHYGLSKARVVFTIHNLEFGAYFIGRAMAYTDKATTVSNTYSKEVVGNPAIAPHLHKFHGILNGIDQDIWDPYNDNFIPVPYTSENVVEGKRAAKEVLQQRMNLKKADVPVVGIISRLTHQKGIHLIKHAIWRTIERGGQVVLLGSAPDPRIQQDFVDQANKLHNMHHDRARLCLTYDEPLSHLIYAGADFILVPSVFEPCGLTQLVAMRYGSIPVVRKTGGLYDTVFDVDHDKERAKAHGLEPNGFNFEGADPAGVDYALDRAISAWYDGREWLDLLRKRVMEQDWSWNRPALEYMELYHAARKD